MKGMRLVGLLMLAVSSVPGSAFAQAVAKGQNEMNGDAFVITTKPSEDGAERFSRQEFNLSYARLVTDRLAVGPRVGVSKAGDQDVTGHIGVQARYYFANLSGRAIPFAEVNTTRTFNVPVANETDLTVLAGLMFPIGNTGGRIRINPYYRRVFFDEDKVGYSNYQSFGISWSVGLRF